MKQLRLLLIGGLMACSPILSAMKVSGELTIAQPTDIYIETTGGETVFHIALTKSGQFATPDVTIAPDVYIFRIGDSKEQLFLDNTDVTINGFLDAANAANSQLEFTGIESNETFGVLNERLSEFEANTAQLLLSFVSDGKGTPEMIAALANLHPFKTYEEYHSLINSFGSAKPDNHSYQEITKRMEALYKYRIGGPAYNFTAIDQSGKTVQLSDFRGKYVLLDFWASWCGPCKAEIKKIRQFYPEFEHKKDVVFISISIDDTKEKWEKGLESTQIPWVSLFDVNGKGFNHTPLKEEYGFRAIPFLVLIDKEGNVMARNLRDKKVKQILSTLNL